MVNRESIENELQSNLEVIFPIISGKVSMAINRMMYRNFRKSNLEITPEQWSVLSHLWIENGVTQQRLCDATFKDKPSMTRLIDNLEKQNLVYRKASENDRRSNLIFLTEMGTSIKDIANEAVYKTMEAALKGVDEEHFETTKRVLRIVFSNIQIALDK